jgi:hypothetical protein
LQTSRWRSWSGSASRGTWDRFYDFLNIFEDKFSEKKLRFCLKTKVNNAKICSLHWFLRKTPIFSQKIVENRRKLSKIAENCRKSQKIVENRRKLSKIAENCDHNIDPWTVQTILNLAIKKTFSSKKK